VRTLASRAVVAAALVLTLAMGGGGSVLAQPAPSAAEWQATGLRDAVVRLVAPSSGGLLAAGRGKLFRTDDAGATWREVPLPPGADPSFGVASAYNPPPLGQGRLAVDPTNADVLYVATESGLLKSVDGGATWRELGRTDLGAELHDLVLGADGASLFAATDGGVLRLPLAELAAASRGSGPGQAVGVLRKVER
jgi:photosystem II stability/assembly factor-like uncharacterized protein